VFPFKDLHKKQNKQLMFKKELAIAKAAKEKNLENIVQLRAVLIGSDHIALELPRY
jgi:hypothetical protein